MTLDRLFKEIVDRMETIAILNDLQQAPRWDANKNYLTIIDPKNDELSVTYQSSSEHVEVIEFGSSSDIPKKIPTVVPNFEDIGKLAEEKANIYLKEHKKMDDNWEAYRIKVENEL